MDGAILAAILVGYLRLASVLGHHAAPPTSTTGLDWLVNRFDAYESLIRYGLMLTGALAFAYSALFGALGGKTIGMRLVGVQLVDRTGRPPSLAHAALRAALSLVSGALLLLGFVYALFDRRRQALHDKLTLTFVVRPLRS